MLQNDDALLNFEPAKHHPDLFRAWEKFVRSDKIDSDIVPSYIMESWLRSRNYRVDPFRLPVESRLSEKDYKARIEKGQSLLDIAKPIMESIYYSLERTRYLVVLYDSDGYHLARIGKRADLERSNNLNITEGLCFDEHSVGTCGFSLVKRYMKPMQIVGCEHYSAPLHYVTGSYAPIINQDQNGSVGIIGVTGAKTMPNAHTLAIVIGASKAIENLVEKQDPLPEQSDFQNKMQSQVYQNQLMIS